MQPKSEFLEHQVEILKLHMQNLFSDPRTFIYNFKWVGKITYFSTGDYVLFVLTFTKCIINSRLRWAGHVARMGERRGAYRALVGKPEGRRPLERPRRRWEDIKMDLREAGWGGVNWIELALDRDRWRALEYTVMNLRVP
jgi:hypothetical protein